KPRDANKICICSLQQEGEENERDTHTESFVNYFANTYASGLLPAENGKDFTEQFLLEVVEILLSYIKRTYDGGNKVLGFHHSHQLLEGLEGFSWELSDQLESFEQMLADCRDNLIYGIKTGHPCYFNQLSSGLDIIGLAGEWLTATANTDMFTYEMAPVCTIMEQIFLKKMHEMIGW
ncbi:DCE1 decarboxylase, partial [Fregata magnificens]|nr:DCE1 decarboxylase [Fregata magnificens]